VCRHRNQFIQYSCVYDRSIGIYHNRHEYNRLAHFHFSGKRCISAGDPHMLTFGNRRYNIYHVHNKWRTLLKSNGFYARTYMSYSRRWGRRSLNRKVYITVGGRTYRFERYGRSNVGMYKRNWRSKTKTITRSGYRVVVDWNSSPQGGYYNVTIFAKGALLTKCSGPCCVGYRGYKGKAKLRRHFRTLRGIKWKSTCTRKLVALARCRKTYFAARFKRVNNNRKWQLIRNCVYRRKHL